MSSSSPYTSNQRGCYFPKPKNKYGLSFLNFVKHMVRGKFGPIKKDKGMKLYLGQIFGERIVICLRRWRMVIYPQTKQNIAQNKVKRLLENRIISEPYEHNLLSQISSGWQQRWMLLLQPHHPRSNSFRRAIRIYRPFFACLKYAALGSASTSTVICIKLWPI